MRVLYANPIFLNYRIPFYKELNKLFKGNFYILYSTKRYKGRPTYEPLLDLIPKELGENAIPYNKEITYYPNTNSFHFIYKDNISKKLPFILTYPYKLWSIIKKNSPDVLISEGFSQWTPYLCLYSFIHRIPIYIGYERTCYTEKNISLIKKIQRKFINCFVSGYFANGTETKKYLETLGISPKKIHIGGMSADSEKLRTTISAMSEYDKVQLKNHYKSTEKGLIYLYSGYFVTRKGIDHLLKSWTYHIKKHTDDHLILLGDGLLFDKMYSIYKTYKSIHFEGRVSYEEIGKYYAISDVFIMPTIEDNWSLVVPEAMACGLPIATSIYNGCSTDLIEESINGITFDTFKHETILNALDFFHHADLKKMGEASIQIEKKFNINNCTKRVYDALTKYNQKN